MILDSSALLAVAFEEPEALAFMAAMQDASDLRMGAPSYVETCIVVASRRGPRALPRLHLLAQVTKIEIIPFSRSAALIAAEAFLKYGKGRHPAGLNFGDCMSYALAKTEVMPLLFKGEDFRLTDVEAAI